MRLVSAEFLKVRKRTGLVLATFGLTVVPAVIMLVVTGGGDFDTGGVHSFSETIGMVAGMSLIAGVLVGATQGTADGSSGVFRDLVVTGRSRLDLYAARVPAGLALVLAAAAAGFAIATLSAVISAGSMETQFDHLGTVAPTGRLLLETAGWLALVAAVGFALAFGVASLVGSLGGSIAVLLALWFVVTPVVQDLESLAALRDVLVISGLDKVMPDGIQPGDSYPISLVAAIAILVAWTTVPMLAGAWRTMTRDA